MTGKRIEWGAIWINLWRGFTNVLWAISVLVGTRERGVEFFAALNAFLLGVFLLLPFNTFETSNTFDSMAGLFTEWGWGILMIGIGLFQLVALSVPSPRSRNWRRYSTFLMMVLYLFLAVGFAIANPRSTAVVTYGVAALSQIWAHIHVEVRIDGNNPPVASQ